MSTIDRNFEVRVYDKRELARMYFPTLSGKAATDRLRRWTRRCRGLVDELERRTDYHTRARTLTARQVRIIAEYLGEP
ncbi:MAG: DUF4248 domain-containing protein [Mediterranea sp.]|nr:DUF4248 domain-containing protein [Mediterranea sp.]